MLTNRDYELIRKQCEMQNAFSPEEISNFTSAYFLGKLFALTADWEKVDSETIVLMTHILGKITVPATEGKWRAGPAVFSNSRLGVDHRIIDEKINDLFERWVERSITPEDFYRQFESIHPFIDGNGRVGHILWAIAVTRETLQWPLSLPPDLFSEGASRKFVSSFGEIEE